VYLHDNNKKNKTMNENLLIKILGWQSESGKEKEQIIPQLMEYLNSLKFKIQIDQDEHGNIFVTKGKKEFYPCLVSHLDDVHFYNKDKQVVRNGDYLLAFAGSKQIGIGGDDKVGMAICLQALNDFKNIKIAFFIKEEVGCQGSNACNLQFFKDCMFIGQPDRKGNSDFINYSNGIKLFDEEFSDFIKPHLEKYNYKEVNGVSTDVGALTKRNVGVATFNISCGYYNPHCFNEYVIISDVKKCYSLITTIILNCNKQFLYTAPIVERPVNNNYYQRSIIYNKLYKEFKESGFYFSNQKYTFAYQKAFEFFDDLFKNIDSYIDTYATDLPYITDIIEEYLLTFSNDSTEVETKPETKTYLPQSTTVKATPTLFKNPNDCPHDHQKFDDTMGQMYCMDCFEYIEKKPKSIYQVDTY